MQPPHMANRTKEWLERYRWDIIPHPAHGPDLAPSDFHLFGPPKRLLGGKKFENEDELIVQQVITVSGKNREKQTRSHTSQPTFVGVEDGSDTELQPQDKACQTSPEENLVDKSCQTEVAYPTPPPSPQLKKALVDMGCQTEPEPPPPSPPAPQAPPAHSKETTDRATQTVILHEPPSPVRHFIHHHYGGLPGELCLYQCSNCCAMQFYPPTLCTLPRPPRSSRTLGCNTQTLPFSVPECDSHVVFPGNRFDNVFYNQYLYRRCGPEQFSPPIASELPRSPCNPRYMRTTPFRTHVVEYQDDVSPLYLDDAESAN
ncbi:histone-lysine N-methyltransferase SETMAR [Plakobranchus ocellatus]|uniref:Histone-lysine N-methyltransferase SETMAR n=1 Tax=Plakobranchus ocellatus TaxID=259542 RepID=A0AAV4A1K6_9GAST|nr:histone-lysine N-methyltransferase SETMAR [Plakobranchus ocellatus]